MLVLVITQYYYGEMSNDLFPKVQAVTKRNGVLRNDFVFSTLSYCLLFFWLLQQWPWECRSA